MIICFKKALCIAVRAEDLTWQGSPEERQTHLLSFKPVSPSYTLFVLLSATSACIFCPEQGASVSGMNLPRLWLGRQKFPCLKSGVCLTAWLYISTEALLLVCVASRSKATASTSANACRLSCVYVCVQDAGMVLLHMLRAHAAAYRAIKQMPGVLCQNLFLHSSLAPQL